MNEQQLGVRLSLIISSTYFFLFTNYANMFSLAIDDGHRVILESISDGVDCEHDYINASYIDVRLKHCKHLLVKINTIQIIID